MGLNLERFCNRSLERLIISLSTKESFKNKIDEVIIVQVRQEYSPQRCHNGEMTS